MDLDVTAASEDITETQHMSLVG